MNQFDGRFAALRHLRDMEALQEPAASRVLTSVANVAEKFGLLGAGLFAKALKVGQTPIEKVIEQIEEGAYEEIARLNEGLRNQEALLNDFNTRLTSQEAKSAYVGAVLHGLRTFDPAKHSRLGSLTIVCIYEKDYQPEGLDSLMRATVELTEHDINVLGSIYRMQIHLFQPRELQKEYRWRIDEIRSLWEQHWDNRAFSSYQGVNGQAFNSSCARLQSVGLIASIGTKTVLRGPTMHDYELLPEGKKFHERLQEITVK